MNDETPDNSLPSRSSQLDFLRTIAILLVFTSHFNIFASEDWFRPVGKVGWIGVDLFFVLSGFLIASQLFNSVALGHRISLTDFYIRRGLRIWPNYFFVLLLYLLIPTFTERSELPPFWKFLTFTQNFKLDFHTFGAFSHAWSLCVEEQFYLILPFFILLVTPLLNFKKSILFLFVVMLGGISLRYLLWKYYVSDFWHEGPQKGIGIPFYREVYYPTYCRLDGLAIGVSIAAIFRLRSNLWKKIMSYANWFLGIGTLLLALALSFVNDEYSLVSATFGYPLLDLSFGCFLIAALSPSGLFSKFRFPGARLGATLAFAFYLTHKQIIHLTASWLTNAGVATTSAMFPAAIFLNCLAVSIVLYFLIERPCLELRDRILHKRLSEKR